MTRLGESKTDQWLEITVNGRALQCREGETVASALLANDILGLRRSPKLKEFRGAFCMMGSCMECTVRIDGVAKQACTTLVYPGLELELE